MTGRHGDKPQEAVPDPHLTLLCIEGQFSHLFIRFTVYNCCLQIKFPKSPSFPSLGTSRGPDGLPQPHPAARRPWGESCGQPPAPAPGPRSPWRSGRWSRWPCAARGSRRRHRGWGRGDPPRCCAPRTWRRGPAPPTAASNGRQPPLPPEGPGGEMAATRRGDPAPLRQRSGILLRC